MSVALCPWRGIFERDTNCVFLAVVSDSDSQITSTVLPYSMSFHTFSYILVRRPKDETRQGRIVVSMYGSLRRSYGFMITICPYMGLILMT